MADWVAAVQSAAAGKSADDAAASIDLTSKYPGFKNERYKAAITALYAELKKWRPPVLRPILNSG